MKPKMSAQKKRHIAAFIIVTVSNLLLLLTIWLLQRYDHIYLDEILYQLKAPAVGTNKSLLGSAYVRVGLLGVVLTALDVLFYRLAAGYPFKRQTVGERYKAYCSSKICLFFRKAVLPLSLCVTLVAASLFCAKLKVFSYLATAAKPSDFIKEHYVKPDDSVLTFPEEKRNLIYLYLESMEATFADTASGGAMEVNAIPELTALAEENVHFSNTDRLGGAVSYSGTTWTAAAMVSQTAGIPVKVPLSAETYGGENSFIPGLISLGEVLQKQGYQQTLLIGSDAAFAGRDSYFTEHGHYQILDVNSLKSDGRLEKDYHEWWGFEDAKLFEYAKQEITRLANEDAPFNFTMLTADTHFPDGYLCEDCPNRFEQQYANVLSCSSSRVYEFVEWLRSQPFFENTTLIISGDHLTMDPSFLKDISPEYVRTVYNCFIGSAVNPIKETNRQFGTFDMFPTTLAAMGVRIQGDRLGLGTDLFSASKTLTEEYGYTTLNEELQKSSEYYNQTFLGMDNKAYFS